MTHRSQWEEAEGALLKVRRPLRLRLSVDSYVQSAPCWCFVCPLDPFPRPGLHSNIFQYDAFRLSGTHMHTQINWTTLANAIQRHYLRVTEAPRPLAPADLDYLKSKVGFGFRCVS